MFSHGTRTLVSQEEVLESVPLPQLHPESLHGSYSFLCYTVVLAWKTASTITSFIQIPVHYFPYDILRTVNEDSLSILFYFLPLCVLLPVFIVWLGSPALISFLSLITLPLLCIESVCFPFFSYVCPIDIKMDGVTGHWKIKPKHLDHPLVAGCSTAHEPCPFHISKWDKGQSKNSKYKEKNFS